MNATLRQLQAFALAARFGSVTRAAERMCVTQSAVSIAIRQLEDILGVRLFDRTTRAVRLTDAGREALEPAELMLRTQENMALNLRALAERRRGHVRFAATPALAAAQMPHIIRTFRKQHPGVEVSMLDVSPDMLVRKVLDDEAQFAIGTVERAEEGISLETLLRDRMVVVCRKDSPLARRRAVKWSELPAYPFVALSKESGVRFIVDDVLARQGLELKPVMQASLLSTIIAFVQAGYGVSIMPRHSVARIDSGLATRPLVMPEVTRELSVIRKANRSLSPAAESFLKVTRGIVAAG